MKIIKTDGIYKIHSDDLITYDKIPIGYYTINYSQRIGFYLTEYGDIEINEKIYGVHQSKADKVMKTFEHTSRNLGIILSGDKGIGKSLFAKMLAITAIENAIPVIIANTYIPGIADFINEISQECCILFDEFDKTFSSKSKEDMGDPQTEMLTLFDGLSYGKKLFVITCNELTKLNNYLVNRPGRFHYHFRFDYPDNNAVTEYLSDNGIPKEEIEKVVSFSNKIKLNYDCLRSIAFELKEGYPFEEAIEDLNIIREEPKETYNITAFFKDGTRVRGIAALDMFNSDECVVGFSLPKERYCDLGSLTIVPEEGIYDVSRNGYVFTNGEGSTRWEFDRDVTDTSDDTEEFKEQCKIWTAKEFDYAVVKHHFKKNIHYKV